MSEEFAAAIPADRTGDREWALTEGTCCPKCRRFKHFANGPNIRYIGLYNSVSMPCPYCEKETGAADFYRHFWNECPRIPCLGFRGRCGCKFRASLKSAEMDNHLNMCHDAQSQYGFEKWEKEVRSVSARLLHAGAPAGLLSCFFAHVCVCSTPKSIRAAPDWLKSAFLPSAWRLTRYW